MNFLKSLNTNDIFISISYLSSIFSLIITILVYRNLSKIRKQYMFTARIPEINQKLSKIASSISERLDMFDGFTPTIEKLLVEAEINLKSMNRKSSGSLKKYSDFLIADINRIGKHRSFFDKVTFNVFRKSINDKNSQKKILEDIHISLHKVVSQCNENIEDSKWDLK